MGKFKKRPVIVEAVQWCGWGGQIVIPGVIEYDPYSELHFTTPDKMCKYCGQPTKDHGWIRTLEGGHIVCFGDWIITGIEGEKYPCKPAIFEKTYKKVEEKYNRNMDNVIKYFYARQGEKAKDVLDRMTNYLNGSQKLHSIDLESCTRVEVIDGNENGRSYVNWSDKNKVKLSIQDNGRTLKVFIMKRD